jgi:hypothetical protein
MQSENRMRRATKIAWFGVAACGFAFAVVGGAWFIHGEGAPLPDSLEVGRLQRDVSRVLARLEEVVDRVGSLGRRVDVLEGREVIRSFATPGSGPSSDEVTALRRRIESLETTVHSDNAKTPGDAASEKRQPASSVSSFLFGQM